MWKVVCSSDLILTKHLRQTTVLQWDPNSLILSGFHCSLLILQQVHLPHPLEASSTPLAHNGRCEGQLAPFKKLLGHTAHQ